MQKPKQGDIQISENHNQADTNIKLMKIFVAQYLISVGFKKAQEHGINLLTDLLIKYIKKIGVKVKRITQLQGRNEANIFQLLFEVDTNLKIPLNGILDYINQQKESSLSSIKQEENVIEIKPPARRENFFIANLIKDIYKSEEQNEIEDEKEFRNILKAEDTYSENVRSTDDAKNIKALSESRSIMRLINRKHPELPKSKEPEEVEGIKESEIKLLKAQQKRYFLSQLIQIRKPVEEINSKRHHFHLQEEDDNDQINFLDQIHKNQKQDGVQEIKEEQNEGGLDDQKNVSTTILGIPSRKIKEIKMEDFTI